MGAAVNVCFLCVDDGIIKKQIILFILLIL